LNGTQEETPVDLAPYATSITLTSTRLAVTLKFDTAFVACDAQPKPGYLIIAKTDGNYRFIGILDTIEEVVERRGERSMQLVARTREGVGGWKTLHASSQVFALGTSYSYVLQSICEDLMNLDSVEYKFPSLTTTVPHTNSQFMDQTPWSMMEEVLMAVNKIPFVTVLNQVSAFSLDVRRANDLTMETARILDVIGSHQQLTIGRVRLKWLDPKLSKSYQQEQMLFSTSMIAGFFDWEQKEKAWWSTDHTQRAENAYMKVEHSVNQGLLPDVAKESFSVIDEYHGEILLQTNGWVATLVVLATATLAATALDPDLVEGIVIGAEVFGETIPVGRIAEAAILTTLFLALLSVGVGQYEIYGTPYDMIHTINTTVAKADNYPAWTMDEFTVESDWVVNETHAQDIVVNQLLWAVANGYAFSIDAVDDPRIEKGDIILFEDNTRMLVLDFNNELTRGAPAIMRLTGVRV
ncbi:MAG: hypothetical protein ACWGQW_01180, partial [bacterium]